MQEHLRAKGWLDSVYFKVLDEIPGDTLPAALRLRTHIKACAPEVRLDETVVDANMLGQEHVDLFCVGDWPGSSVSAQMAEMAARGQEVWTYNNYRNMVDLPAGHTRLMGWVSHLFGLGGYMHWAWAWNRDPWQDAYTDPFGAGEGFLVTLDRQRKRVLDSIRWELFRQTSQDFEMLRMLEQAGGDSKGLCKQLVRSFADPETDPERFRQVRHQLITQLDGL